MTTTHVRTISTKDLVFGLQWQTLIGGDLSKRSYQEAMRFKASHYVKAGQHSSVVGYVSLSVEKSGKEPREMYSAAAVFALSNPTGAFITQVVLSPEQVWVVATLDGAVIKGTDVLLDNQEEATRMVNGLIERFPEASIVTDSRENGPYLNEKSKLIEAKTTLELLPSWVKYCAVAGAVLILSKVGLNQWYDYQERLSMDNNIEQYVDVVGEWKKSLDNWADSTYVDGTDGYNNLFDNIMEIPLSIGRWSLFEATCSPRGIKAWACQAKYERSALGTYQTFVSALPEGWSSKLDDIDHATGTWTIPASRYKLKRDRLTPISTFGIDYTSQLQKVVNAYKQRSFIPPKKIDIPKPTVPNTKGELVPVQYPDNAPISIQIPSIQTIAVNGPLRSLAALPVPELTTIKKVHLVVKGFDTQPSLTSSALLGEVIGEIYVR